MVVELHADQGGSARLLAVGGRGHGQLGRNGEYRAIRDAEAVADTGAGGEEARGPRRPAKRLQRAAARGGGEAVAPGLAPVDGSMDVRAKDTDVDCQAPPQLIDLRTLHINPRPAGSSTPRCRSPVVGRKTRVPPHGRRFERPGPGAGPWR